jgi:hypothetical protein
MRLLWTTSALHRGSQDQNRPQDPPLYSPHLVRSSPDVENRLGGSLTERKVCTIHLYHTARFSGNRAKPCNFGARFVHYSAVLVPLSLTFRPIGPTAPSNESSRRPFSARFARKLHGFGETVQSPKSPTTLERLLFFSLTPPKLHDCTVFLKKYSQSVSFKCKRVFRKTAKPCNRVVERTLVL